MPPAPRHLLALRSIPEDRLRSLLAEASRFADADPSPLLRGRIIATLFFENSTRTRLSFAVAAQKLGAQVIDLAAAQSSTAKGESITDTARTIEAIGADALIVRSPHSGGARVIADAVRCPVINAGDGRHEHPTQGLLDTLAIARAHHRVHPGSEAVDLTGLHVLIVGDVANSRVARSDTAALTRLGARVTLVGPPSLAPTSLKALGAEVSHELDAHLAHADAVVMLRVQLERMGSTMPMTVRAYRAGYALTAERAAHMKRDAVILHPAPMNRGLEIDGDAADGPRSLVTEQVRLGVAVRCAVLAELLGPPARPIRPTPHAEALA